MKAANQILERRRYTEPMEPHEQALDLAADYSSGRISSSV